MATVTGDEVSPPSVRNPHASTGAETTFMRLLRFVPDFVVRDIDANTSFPHVIQYSGAMTLMDISGFTAMTDKFTQGHLPGGTSALSEILNQYLRKILNIVFAHEGDVTNFAGDAMLVIWPQTSVKESVETALKCALEINKTCQNYVPRNSGVALNVKTGISAGHGRIVCVASQGTSGFALHGGIVQDVVDAEHFCHPQERPVVISPKAKAYLHMHPELQDVCELTELESSGGFCLVTAVDGWQDSRLGPMVREALRFAEYTDEKEKLVRMYILRPILKQVDTGLSSKMMSEIRQVQTIFMTIKLMELSEISYDHLLAHTYDVVIEQMEVFDGLLNKFATFDKGFTFLCMFGIWGYSRDQLGLRALHAAAKIRELLNHVYNVAGVSMGVTSGMVYCGIVGHKYRQEYTVIGHKVNLAARMMMGYPGVISCDEETVNRSTLQPSAFRPLPPKEMKGLKGPVKTYELLYDANQLEAITKTTTGSDDDETYATDSSKQPVRDAQPIQSFLYPPVDQNAIFLSVEQAIHECSRIAGKSRAVQIQGNSKVSRPKTHVFEGTTGCGKSRLLDAVLKDARRIGCSAIGVSVPPRRGTRSKPFRFLVPILKEIIGLNEDMSIEEKHNKLTEMYEFGRKTAASKALDIIEDDSRSKSNRRAGEGVDGLWLLNETFGTKFHTSMAPWINDELKMREKLSDIYLNLLLGSCKQVKYCLIIGIDNAQNLDHGTWSFFRRVFVKEKIIAPLLLLLTLPPGEDLPKRAHDIVLAPTTVRHLIGGLPPELLASLACQFLEVRAISEELEDLLISISGGNCKVCKKIIVQLARSNKIYLIPHSENPEEIEIYRPKYGLPQFLVPFTYYDKLADIQGSRHNMFLYTNATVDPALLDTKILKWAILRRDVDVTSFKALSTMKEVMLTGFDHLSATEQNYLKFAAILGSVFCLEFLSLILKIDANSFRRITRMLIAFGYLECPRMISADDEVSTAKIASMLMSASSEGAARDKNSKEERNSTLTGARLFCRCLLEAHGDSNLIYCQSLKFSSPLQRKTIYNLLTDQQKTMMHKKVTKLLLNYPRRCRFCGGGSYVTVHYAQEVNYFDICGTTNSLREIHMPYLNRDVSAQTYDWKEAVVMREKAAEERMTDGRWIPPISGNVLMTRKYGSANRPDVSGPGDLNLSVSPASYIDPDAPPLGPLNSNGPAQGNTRPSASSEAGKREQHGGEVESHGGNKADLSLAEEIVKQAVWLAPENHLKRYFQVPGRLPRKSYADIDTQRAKMLKTYRPYGDLLNEWDMQYVQRLAKRRLSPVSQYLQPFIRLDTVHESLRRRLLTGRMTCECPVVVMSIMTDLYRHLKISGKTNMAMLALANIGIAATVTGDFEEADEICDKLRSVVDKTMTTASSLAKSSASFQILRARSLRLEAILSRVIGDKVKSKDLLKLALEVLDYPLPDEYSERIFSNFLELHQKNQIGEDDGNPAPHDDPTRAWFLTEACCVLRELISSRVPMTSGGDLSNFLNPRSSDSEALGAEMQARYICALMLSRAARSSNTFLNHLLFANSALMDMVVPSHAMRVSEVTWESNDTGIPVLARHHTYSAEEILLVNKILFSLLRINLEMGDALKTNTMTYYVYKILPPVYFTDQASLLRTSMKCLTTSFDMERLLDEAAQLKALTADVPLISPNRIMYFVMCLFNFLETGLSWEPVPYMMGELQRYLRDASTFNNSYFHYLILSGIALWNKRARKHKLASLYYKAAKKRMKMENPLFTHTVSDFYSFLIEVDLLTLSEHLENLEWHSYEICRRRVEDGLRAMEAFWEKMPTGSCKVFLLKAYLAQIRDNQRQSDQYLEKARDLALDLGQRAYYLQAEHVKKLWASKSATAAKLAHEAWEKACYQTISPDSDIPIPMNFFPWPVPKWV